MDDLGPADHLFQLVDPAVDQADLFFCLLIFRVVLDVTRLEGLLEPLGSLDAAGTLNFELSFQPLESFGCEKYRFR